MALTATLISPGGTPADGVAAAQFFPPSVVFRSGAGPDESGKPPAACGTAKVMVTASRVSGSTFATLMNETLSWQPQIHLK
jgi:hypothetical protein